MYKSIINKIGIFSLSFFVAATAAYIYSPVIRSNAEENASLNVETNVNSVASLTLDTSSLDFSIIPTAAGVFESKPITATVDTNANGGYELYLSSIDESTDMTSTNSDVIASDFTGSVTSSSMPNNKWGYSLDDTDFSKIPALSNQVVVRSVNHFPATSERSTPVYFGTKISSTLTSGRYSKEVVFSVVTHDEPLTANDNCDNIFCIEEMQKMTPEICANTTTPLPTAREVTFEKTDDNTKIPRTVMRDNRDNKLYLVSKFADGKCWMSQNLALDLSTETTLTNENTDLNSVTSWTPAYSTFDTYAELEDPDLQRAGWERAYSVKPAIKYLRDGVTTSDTPTTDDGKREWERVGNYYNWSAATATSIGIDVDSYNANDIGAKDSICPKGWRLPKATQNNNYSIDAAELKAAYGGSITPYTDAFAFIASGEVLVTGPYDGGVYSANSSNVGRWGEYVMNHARAYYSQGVYVETSESDIYAFSTAYLALPQIRCIAREN